jgi:hypothetical protein
MTMHMKQSDRLFNNEPSPLTELNDSEVVLFPTVIIPMCKAYETEQFYISFHAILQSKTGSINSLISYISQTGKAKLTEIRIITDRGTSKIYIYKIPKDTFIKLSNPSEQLVVDEITVLSKGSFFKQCIAETTHWQ